MQRRRHSNTSRPASRWAAAAVMLITAGAAGSAAAEPASVEAPGLPTYEVGETVIYSDNVVQYVTAVDEQGVHWAGDGGKRYVASRNFVVPELHEKFRGRTVESRVVGSPDELFPLKPGNFTRFIVGQAIIEKNGSRVTRTAHWQCEVAGTEVVEVPAGRFDTFRIVCDQVGRASRAAKRRVIYSYAPSLGHVARISTHDFRTNESRTVEVVRLLSKEESSEERIEAILQTWKSRS